MEDTRLLKEIFLFRDLSPLDLTQWNKVLQKRKVKKGEWVILEEEEGDAMFIVKEGEFEVIKGPIDQGKVVARLTVGDHFGEVALIDNLPRSASVRAGTDGELLMISRSAFEKILRDHPHQEVILYRNFLKSLCERLRAANELLLLYTSSSSS
jgi:CRP-like cAMP-binding protein